MVDVITDADLRTISRTFKAMDVEGDGLVSIDDFRSSIQRPEFVKALSLIDPMESKEYDFFFENADVNRDGYLCYEEILHVCVAAKLVAKEERLRETFQRLDANDDGFLSSEEIVAAFDLQDRETAAEIIEEADVNGDGLIEYDEFLDLWRQNPVRIPSLI